MKKLLNILLPLSLFWMLTASRCKKDVLPPETQDGKNTIGCYIDGELFVPGGGGLAPIKTCYYQLIYPSESGYVFQLAAKRHENNDCGLKAITITLDSIRIVEGNTYKLSFYKVGNGNGRYNHYPPVCGDPIKFETFDESSGEIYFRKFDEVNHIAAGTFWFTAVNSLGDTVKITDGRFDMEFTR
ncbi:MAG: hypothetical protein J0I84_03395 [Terrimonas sp.]|nr:hypothetical protein [Terrimonas sp.]